MGKIITVDFRSSTIFAIERDDGVFVVLKPLVEAMGLEWQAQRQRINRDAILSEGASIMLAPSMGGGAQEALCLKLELVNGWLFTIDDSRIKDDDVRERVLVYKRECYAVLFRHFYGQHTATEVPQQTEEAEGSRIRQVTEARQTFGVRSAAQLWFKLGLPVVPAMLHASRQTEFEYGRIISAEDLPAEHKNGAA